MQVFVQNSIFKEVNNHKKVIFGSLDEILENMRVKESIEIILTKQFFSIEDYIKLNQEANKIKSALVYTFYQNDLDSLYTHSEIDNNLLGEELLTTINAMVGPISLTELKGSSENLILIAHGEGAHLNLFPYVLCSCIENGNQEYCRKSKAGQVIPINSLNFSNYIIFTCNGALFRNELFPDGKSILFSLLNKNSYVITTIMPIEVEEEHIKLAELGIKANMSYQKICKLLNAIYNYQKGLTPFICCRTKDSQENYLKNTPKFYLQKVKLNDKENLVVLNSRLNNNIFRVEDELLYFHSDKMNKSNYLDIEYFDFRNIEVKRNKISFYLCFLKELISYYEYRDSSKNLNEFKNFFWTLEKYYSIISANLKRNFQKKILEGARLTDILKNIEIILKSVSNQLLNNVNKLELISHYEEFVQIIMKKVLFENNEHFCNRCGSLLLYSRAVHVEFYITEYFCPICGMHSLQLGGESGCRYVDHYSEIKDDTSTIFFVEIINEQNCDYFVYFQLVDKSVNKTFFKKAKVFKTNKINFIVDTQMLSEDIHSYKALIFSENGVDFIHGKYVHQK
jgi:transcription elongation factor Elf1